MRPIPAKRSARWSTWNMPSRTPAWIARASGGSSPSRCSSSRSTTSRETRRRRATPRTSTTARSPKTNWPSSAQIPEPTWLRSELESRVLEYAAQHLVPSHLGEVRLRKEALIDKTRAAVHERLTKEINYWDHRAVQLKEQELAGRTNARLNSGLGPAASRRAYRPAPEADGRIGAGAEDVALAPRGSRRRTGRAAGAVGAGFAGTPPRRRPSRQIPSDPSSLRCVA